MRRLLLAAALLLPGAAGAQGLDEVPATLSNFGRVGLLEMPNARFRPDGTVEGMLAFRHQRRFGTVNFQALPFLEATFRLTERLNATAGRGTTSDRAFDVKLRVWDENAWRPALAIGLQDFLGTGLYAGEYVVASKRFWGLDVSGGVGWGRLATGNDLRNPLGLYDRRFETRPRSVGTGGTFALNSVFRGPQVGFFGGVEYSLPAIATPLGELDGLRLKVEYSADALRDERGGYPARTTGLRGRADSRWNAGLDWQPNRFVNLGASFVHGTDLLLRASLRLHPDEPPIVPREAPPPLVPRPAPVGETAVEAAADPSWTERLGRALGGVSGRVRLGRDDAFGEAGANAALAARLFPALRAGGFVPLSVALHGEEARISVAGGRFRTVAQVAGRVARLAQGHLPPEVERLRVLWERDGVVIARLVLLREAFEQAAAGRGSAEEIFATAQPLPAFHERDPAAATLGFPRLSWGVAPTLNLQVGDPQSSVRWQLGAAAGARLELPWGVALAGGVAQRLAGNLDGGLPSDSVLPHVRSDFARYARAGSTTLPALYAERLWMPAPDVYARATAGLLEPMFGGLSGEVLWRPHGATWAVGLDVNWVAQRQYTQTVGTLGYSVVTGHASLYADLPWWNTYAVLRGGRYLAGDWGGTLEVGRRFASGIEVGGFATLTNVRFRDFGEGSFDKGIYVRVPFDVFGPQSRSVAALNIRPVQRDGGQRLAVDSPLWAVSRDGRDAALREGAGWFLR
ncbi:YjbH domain-containing protein [Roseococcus sp. DSY-14]|uniref:YjbH domain-containing protein n=1 Tax=Roseococcus sp. DSY-14 TaxID=3369650 RepID=UPI00387B69FB